MTVDPNPVELRVLGPLEVTVNRESIPLGPSKHRALFAALLVEPNRTVSIDHLADAVWNENPPPAVVSSIHVAVSGLRRHLHTASEALSVDLVQTRPPGYLCPVPAGALDLSQFRADRDAAVAAHRRGQHDTAAGLLRRGLDRWRGAALADLQDYRFATTFAAGVDEERLTALQLRIDQDLLAGRDDQVLPELLELTSQYPLREHFWAQRATALYRRQQQAEALACLRTLRDLLDTELGIQPSPPLQELELHILRQDLQAQSTQHRFDTLAGTITEVSTGLLMALITPWGAVHTVPRGGLSLGRAPDNDLVLAEDRVSRHHALVRIEGDRPAVIDLGSRNGTYLNGHRVVGEAELADQDHLRLGSVTLSVAASLQE